jgi:hypothetical protein
VNDFGHSLNGRLGGYYRGLVSWVQRVSGYDPKNSGYDWFPPVENDWETKHPVLDMARPLLIEEEGRPT